MHCNSSLEIGNKRIQLLLNTQLVWLMVASRLTCHKLLLLHSTVVLAHLLKECSGFKK